MPRLRELALDTLDKLLPEAERLGLVIAVENSYEPPNSASEVVGLISKFDSPHIGCCFDTGHACLMSPFPGKERSKYFDEINDAWWEGLVETADSFEKMKPYIVTSHIHDNDGWDDQHLAPYFGRLDWNRFMLGMKEIGYREPLSFETSPTLKAYDRELTPEVLALISATGRMFSRRIEAE